MKDRRQLQDELNRINDLYQQYDLELRKSGGSDAQRQQMRDTLNAKKAKVMAEMGDDLQKLNLGKDIKVSGATTSGLDVDQSKLPDVAKQVNLGKEGMLKKLGKKVAGVIPLAGAGMAALSGDPAMAAEEAAGDIPFFGQAYEAIKPEVAGNEEEERMMLAEDKARKAYSQSPAAASAKEAALKKLRGY
jgi:hypothetical protein